MEPAGYPSVVLYLTLLLGLPMALVRPFKAFLVVAFLVAAADATAFTYTRTQLLGPYFNANDACLLVALASALSHGVYLKNGIQLPNVVKWIIAVLLIGFTQSWFVMGGFSYEVLRSLRWAMTLPVYFVIGATMVDDERKVRQLLIALFLGSAVSAVEHVLFVRSLVDHHASTSFDIGQFRTIAFRSPGVWFLLAGIIWLPKIKGINRIVMLGAGALFAVSVLLNQTRSIWISSIAALPLIFLLFKQKKRALKTVMLPVISAIMFAALFIFMYFITPNISPADIVMERVRTLTDQDIRFRSTITRLLSFKLEMEAWSKGSLVFGRGLSYYSNSFSEYHEGFPVAWGHLGHVTTLAQLGLIGLLVYSFYLPKIVIQASRRLWLDTSPEIKFIGLLAGTSIIWSWLCFFMSDSFLSQHAADGVIFGTAWRQARLLSNNITLRRDHGQTTENYRGNAVSQPGPVPSRDD